MLFNLSNYIIELVSKIASIKNNNEFLNKIFIVLKNCLEITHPWIVHVFSYLGNNR